MEWLQSVQRGQSIKIKNLSIENKIPAQARESDEQNSNSDWFSNVGHREQEDCKSKSDWFASEDTFTQSSLILSEDLFDDNDQINKREYIDQCDSVVEVSSASEDESWTIDTILPCSAEECCFKKAFDPNNICESIPCLFTHISDLMKTDEKKVHPNNFRNLIDFLYSFLAFWGCKCELPLKTI